MATKDFHTNEAEEILFSGASDNDKEKARKMSSDERMALEQKIYDLHVEPAAEITMDNTYVDTKTDTIQMKAQAAVKLVLDDCHFADNYININQWAAGWTMADLLYQSPSSQTAFDGGNIGNANVPKFMVSNHIAAIVPKMMNGLFYETPPFLMRPRPGTSPQVIEAKTALFTAQLDIMNFKIEVKRFLNQMALMGTGIMKWGYTEHKKTIKKYVRESAKYNAPAGVDGQEAIDTPDSDEVKFIYDEITVSHPWTKFCDLRTVLVDPGCRVGDIRQAKWVIYRDFATYSDLNKLRGKEGYDIPEENVLRMMFEKPAPGALPDNIALTIPEGMLGYLQHAMPRSFKTSADPNQSPMEILERWDNEKVIVILSCGNHNILLRNEPNPYGVIPFLSANWRDIQDCFYGQGLGLLIGSEQIVEQGVTNLALDLLAYGLQPTAVRKMGMNPLKQDVRWEQGGIIEVEDDVRSAFAFLQMPPVPAEAWQFIQQAKASGAETSGANEQVMMGAGSPGIHTTGMRTATGAGLVGQANATRLDLPEDTFVEQVFVPWLYKMDELNNDLLPTSVLRRTLGDELGEAFKVDHVDFRNARIEYEVLAGSKLGAKKEMLQAFPVMIQLLNNPTFIQNLADNGYRLDGPAIFRGFADGAGWRYSQAFMVKMDDQQKAQHQANSPAGLQAANAKTQLQMQAQKFQQEQQMEDQKQLGKAGNEALRATYEKELQPEYAGGDVTQGYGSETVL
jgi:hypothetical protein